MIVDCCRPTSIQRVCWYLLYKENGCCTFTLTQGWKIIVKFLVAIGGKKRPATIADGPARRQSTQGTVPPTAETLNNRPVNIDAIDNRGSSGTNTGAVLYYDVLHITVLYL